VVVVCTEHRHLNIISDHAHLLVPASQINLGEEFGTAEFVDDRDWKHASDSLGI
jgi:hypothetical protein